MRLLVDENVPASVSGFLKARGHQVDLVRDLFPAGTPDPVIAQVGDRLSAIVVTWDQDFDRLVERVPTGSRAAFRRLGRISFRCNEVQGRQLIERWIEMIEFHYARCLKEPDFRMIVQIQKSAVKIF